MLILATAPGERPMRPEFGCGIHDYVFETIEPTPSAASRTRSASRSTAGSRASRSWTSTSTSRAPAGASCDRAQLRAARHQRRAQPRLPVLPRSGGGHMRLPDIDLDDRDFQELVSEARVRVAQLPGVDRAQRLRSRHHADRAVRVDDRDARLPAQPHPRQGSRALLDLLGRASTRRPRPRTDVRFRLAAPARGRWCSRAADRGRRAARRRGAGRRVPDGRRLHDPAARAGGLRRRARGRLQGRRHGRRTRARRAATSCPSACRRRSATRSTSASTPRWPPRPAPSTWTARRPAAPASTPRIRRCSGRSPRRARLGKATCCPTRPAASTTAAASWSCTARPPHRDARRRPALLLGALPPATGPARPRGRALHPPARDLRRSRPRWSAPRPRHARHEVAETIGESDGTPGQCFELRYAPVLPLEHARDARGARPRDRRAG